MASAGGLFCGSVSAQSVVEPPNSPVPATQTPSALRRGYPPSLTSTQADALKRLPAYLPDTETPDSFRILPPAPRGNSPARQADIAAYRETQALQGGARWRLAASDAVITPFTVLDDESCALGVQLNQDNAPRLIELLARALRDTVQIVNRAKEQSKQVRPFVALGGQICTDQDYKATAKSYAYPSGHATYGWAAGLILAELAPDRATPILARARAFGESRVVCGVHWVSDVEEGRTNGSILVAVLHSDAKFEADLAAAKREVDAARAKASLSSGSSADPMQCAADASAHTPWTR